MILHYVALGDSLTVGVGTFLFLGGFVQRYRRMIQNDFKENVQVKVFARSGLETGEILHFLDDPYVSESIKKAKIITITAGGNDLIHAVEKYSKHQDEHIFMEALATSLKNYSRMIRLIHEAKGDKKDPYFIRLMNLYNPFPGIPLAEKWITAFDKHLKTFSNAPNVKIANIYKAFKGHEGEYLSIDHVHPNNSGYQVIAEKFHELGYYSKN